MIDRSKRKIIIFSLIIALVIITVVYAALSTSLNIGFNVTQQSGSWSIYFTNIANINESGGATLDTPVIDSGKTSLTFNANLIMPLDEVSFTVDVVNEGSVNAVLSSVVLKGVDTAKNNQVTFTATYVDGKEIMVGDLLSSGDTKTIKVTASFDDVSYIVEEDVILNNLGLTLIYSQHSLGTNQGGGSGGESGDIEDSVIVNAPNLLNSSLTPVVYNGTNWVVADTTKEWYNYSTGQWANAVILESGVTKNVGDTVIVPTATSTTTEVKAMYVWIPRYEYKITGTYGTHPGGIAGISSLPGAIEVNFISTNQTSASSGYILHPAFTWDNDNNGTIATTEHISGIWVGKFETSASTTSTCYTTPSSDNCNNTEQTPYILPNAKILRYQSVSKQFTTAQKFSTYLTNSTNTDSHMMKNSEWGAVAYLSQSTYGKYGNSMYTGANKEVYVNNSSSFYTGRSGGSPSATSTTVGTCYYNDITDRGSGRGSCGAGASTTGNIYGVYDMSGGVEEYVMGYLTTANSNYASNPNSYFGWTSFEDWAGFTSKPDVKYFDAYINTPVFASACNSGICYGHALDETSSWYSDYAYFLSADEPWFSRGGYYDNAASAGVFGFSSRNGAEFSRYGFRSVLIEAEDLEEEIIPYKDPILAGSDPNLLNNSLVPVVYNGSNWVVADTTTEWYNYAEQEWANAVILEDGITKNVGDTVTVPTATSTTTEVKAMYVWIPRYEYKINGTYGKHTSGTNGTSALPGAIDINFISISTTSASSGYRIHPAFTWDNDNNGTIAAGEHISGMWVGKFETSAASSSTCYTTPSSDNCNNTEQTPYILPNAKILRYQSVSKQFTTAQKFSTYLTNSTNTDSHMMKNSEWGAVAYLSQSIYGKYGNSMYTSANKEVYQNRNSGYITGNSNGTPGTTTTGTQCVYSDITDRGSGKGACGAGASTTGNIYGVYDMSGGAHEYTMAYYTGSNSNYASNPNTYFGWTSSENRAEFTSKPDNKYFDNFKTASNTTACNSGICYGHALSEVNSWYGDSITSSSGTYPWLMRGGRHDTNATAGVFRSGRWYGNAGGDSSFRAVLIKI